MLVLSRRVGQGLLIGPDVRIIINGLRGDQVSLAISAPVALRIIRPEVLRTPADRIEWEEYCETAQSAGLTEPP